MKKLKKFPENTINGETFSNFIVMQNDHFEPFFVDKQILKKKFVIIRKQIFMQISFYSFHVYSSFEILEYIILLRYFNESFNIFFLSFP